MWTLEGDYWITSERLKLQGLDAFIRMNPVDNYKKYPIGVFSGEIFDPNGYSLLIIYSNINYIVFSCDIKKLTPIELTISSCTFPDQFTCKSGSCVDIFLRCNNKRDCDDGSDEESCDVLRIPSSYDSSLPPELDDEINQPNNIYAQIKVINVDEVNTVTMTIGLTIELFFSWRDHRINYANLQDFKDEIDAFKLVPAEEKIQVWTPLPRLVHDNAIIGEIKEVDFYQLGIQVENNALPLSSEYSRENLIYHGAENTLVVSQRMKLKYRCDFFLLLFPFDDTTCDFYLSIRTVGNNSLKLINDENSVLYEGPKTLNEFKILNFWSETTHYETNTSFIYSFEFTRLYEQHLMTTFFQSFLLWFLAFLTLFIDEDDFSNRFMGAVTALLVLAALLASLGDLLPKTAYFKYVDLWFNWFITNIFFIILVHVVIDFFNRRGPLILEQEEQKAKFQVNQVSSSSTLFSKVKEENLSGKKIKLGGKINSVSKILHPLFTSIFICIYIMLNQ